MPYARIDKSACPTHASTECNASDATGLRKKWRYPRSTVHACSITFFMCMDAPPANTRPIAWAAFLSVCVALTGGSVAGCDERDDGTSPRTTTESLPELKLTDETRDLLFTWLDERGNTHTAVFLSEIPEAGRAAVRVVTKDAGHGSAFYVADLSKKQADLSYPVRTMPRSEWEALLEQRRAAQRKPPPAPATPADDNPGMPRGGHPRQDPQPRAEVPAPVPGDEAAHGVAAIVYGAEWCGPCHEARRHLARRGAKITYYDIEQEPERGRELQRKLRAAKRSGGSIPVVDIQGTLVVGYNPRAIDQALAKATQGGLAL
ncbi:MAG: glutaredoxin family protein [Myxococcales bacterium]|nr:glutaredoxin family protein [Myxococcales bacterium]